MFEDIVEKATELGVHQIVPIISQRVVSSMEHHERKMERWKLAAMAAIKQCGSPWLPVIEPPVPLEQSLRPDRRIDLSLVAALQSATNHPRYWLERLKKAPLQIGIWVGPEGDFTPEEISFLQKSEVHPVTLGNLVLRVETAAIYCLSVLNYEMQWSFQP